jgi:hypothetical protein
MLGQQHFSFISTFKEKVRKCDKSVRRKEPVSPHSPPCFRYKIEKRSRYFDDTKKLNWVHNPFTVPLLVSVQVERDE